MVEGFGDYTDGIQEIISHILVPTFFGNEAPFELHHLNLFSLPTSLGGLGIPFLKDEATQQYAASLSLTSPHVESIVAQDVELRERNCNMKTQNQLRSQLMSAKAERLKVKAVAVYEALPPDSKRFMKQSQDKGASSWVNVIPLEDEGFNVSKEELLDSLRIRLGTSTTFPSHRIPGLPCVTCVCRLHSTKQPDPCTPIVQ